MARTIRKTGRDGKLDTSITGVRPWHRRESKWARKATNRTIRNSTRAALATVTDHDDLIVPSHTRTGGWISH